MLPDCEIPRSGLDEEIQSKYQAINYTQVDNLLNTEILNYIYSTCVN